MQEVATLKWSHLPWFKRAFDDGASDGSVRFLVGSCLFPGGPADREQADSVFAAMRLFIEGRGRPGADHLLLAGDLIYADASSDLFDPAAPLERFRERYQRALGGPGRRLGGQAHWVMAHVPTYFAVDDHEISDNWPRDQQRRRHPRGERYSPLRELAFARREACNFLMHHARTRTALWYAFESRGFRFFVFDTRTERKTGDRGWLHTLIDDPDRMNSQPSTGDLEAQKTAFKRWIREGAGHRGPPVIVTGSPLGPITREVQAHPVLADHQDTLIGYPGFLCWLHGVLVRSGIKSVIWISGDAHLSSLCSYQLQWSGVPVAVHQLTASGLFAPLPFANHSWSEFNEWVRFERNVSTDSGRGSLVIEGRQQPLYTSSGHFVEVNLTSKVLEAQAHDVQGNSGPSIRIDVDGLP